MPTMTSRLRTCLSLAVTLAICMSSSRCLALDERRILLEFFEATNGAQWLVNDNWGSDAPICSWKGVSCLGGSVSGDSDVDTIQLPKNNLAGTIPSSLYSMPLLRFLDLEGNSLTNAGFEGFQRPQGSTGVTVSPLETLALNDCNLRDVTGIGHAPSSLRDLRLASNSLNGDFPVELLQLTNLKRLFLDQNSIDGTIPSTIGNMQMLIDFHAIAVPFKGQIPSEFGLLTKLVTLVLRDNEFTGTIPNELTNMAGLEILSIGRSPEAGQGQLSGPLPSFNELPFLELLDFSLNRLNGTIPRDFLLGNERTDDLVIVRLDGNMLTGTLPKQLGWIDSLDLGITGNKLVGPIPPELCLEKQWMTGLVEQFGCDAIACPGGTYNEAGKQTLTSACQPCEGPPTPYLGQTTCNGVTDSTDQPWRILSEFYLAVDGKSWANREGWDAIDKALGNSRLSDLQSTSLDYCHFFGVTCNQAGEVEKIELADNALYGTIPPSVFLLPTMTTFNVTSNLVKIEKEGYEAIVSTNVLSKLVLSHSAVNTLTGLATVDSIQELYIDGLSFQSNLTNDLFTLTNLRILDFQNSNLQGTIPPNVGNLRSLVRAQFRWNQLTGQLPSELALLTNLEELDLSYNDFQGTFPTQMNVFPKLRELELSRAERGGLSGSLPDLAGLPALAVVGFGHNKFQGSIPTSFLSGVTDHSRNMSVGLGYNSLTGMVPHHLDVFASVVIELEGNSISDLPSMFCDNSLWQVGYVGDAHYGCNAILCPPGTWNMNGRETNGSLCEPCEASEFYGATDCGDVTLASGAAAQSEQEILDMLFEATNGKDWIAPHDSWLSSPVCSRAGVSCDDQGNVEALRLNNFGMTGEIPTEIFQLTKNRVLGITDNSVELRFDGIEQSLALETLLLSNTKVRSLEGLQHAPPTLRALHVARNDIEGTFPISVLGLHGLNKVFLNQNKFSGTIPSDLRLLSSLTELHIWENHLTGHIPSEIGLLTGLLDLNCRSNFLSGPIPVEFGNLTQIQKIDLSDQRGDDKLSGPLLPFTSNPFLHALNVSKNEFAGTIPADMLAAVNKTKLVVLDMSSNQLSGGVPSQFGTFQQLDIFAVDNMISELPEALCSMGNWMQSDVGALGTCDAIMCPPEQYSVSGRANSTVSCVPCPTGETAMYYGSISCRIAAQDSERDILNKFYIDLEGDKWASSFNWGTDSGVCTWFGITCNADMSIVEIKLASNQIVSTREHLASVSKIFELPNLQVLDLKGNSMYLDFQQISFGPSLESLRVSGTGLTSLSGIGRAINLRRLHATDNLLNGTLPSELYDLSELRSLYLSFNSIGGSIPGDISKLTNLQEVYLYGNMLEGSLPTEIGLLVNLRELVLARNHLTGTIPSEVSSLSSLEQLSLYDQQGGGRITGKLPTFANAVNLWFFDVSECDLTGTIPSNFMENSVHLNATVTLVLKNNEISGTIPSSLIKFDALDIDLTGNKIETISNEFCEKGSWMKGEVAIIGSCDAILCSKGSYNENGRQSSAESPCSPCDDLSNVPYLGQTQCRSYEGERGTLNLLFSATGGILWTSNNKWASDAPICSWEGVECADGSPEDDTGVTAIKLEKMNLAGSLPSAIWSLPSLRTLLLTGNDNLAVSFDGLSNAAKTLEVLQLSGTKMDSIEGIEQATTLKELFIDENGLTGNFPTEIFDLHASLEKFRLSANYYYGSLPTEITKMTKLIEFHAADNEFYATIPSEIALLTNLQSVALNENLFYGTLPTELSNMQQLQIFSVRRERKAGPRLTGSIPSFENCPSLTVLFLDGNDFFGEIPSTFLKSSTNVYLVDLKNNSLSGAVPETLNSFSELDIRLEGNQISNLSQSFCSLSDWMGGNVGRLKSCDAIMCRPGTANPNGRALSSPGECKSCSSPGAAPFYGSRTCEPVLTEKEILVKVLNECGGSGWKIAKNWNTDVDVCEWHGIGCKDGHVILVNLGANNLIGSPPPELFDLPKLEILWLHSNPIQFSFAHIGRATNLMDLRVDETALSSLDGVGAALYLTSLHVGFNSIAGPFPAELLQLKNIRTLSMNNNAMTGTVPDVSDLIFLRSLRLGSNKFQGTVPAFNNMHILNTIDLSNNALSGSIPPNFLERVGPRLALELDLSNNRITGTVPSSLERFDTVNLYLRGNMIEAIPSVLCNKANWNNGDVGKNGCDALLCPAGTSSFDGRYSSRSSGCATCTDTTNFLGQATCTSADFQSSAFSPRSVKLALVAELVLIFCYML